MSRRHAARAVGILTVLALVFGVFAGAASARTHSRHMSRHQKAVVRHQLMRSIKKNPRIIKKASFLHKASLVNFQLPVTIRLRTNVPCEGSPQPGTVTASNVCAGTIAGSNGNAHVDPLNPGSASFPNYVYNPNVATIDLGPSLGSREIDLGGTLPALIKFHDSFDGGALGNVDLSILDPGAAQAYGWPAGSTGLTSTSIPLLWNTQTSASTSAWYLSGGDQNAGCGNFTNQSGNGFTGVAQYPSAGSFPGGVMTGATWGSISATGFSNGPASQGSSGYSLYTPVASAGESAIFGLAPASAVPGVPFVSGPTSLGLVPEYPGVDAIENIAAGSVAPVQSANPLVQSVLQTDSRNNLSVNDIIGGNPSPFPGAAGGYPNPVGGVVGNASDTVLRTGALKLSVAAPGQPVTTPTGPPSGTSVVIGQSGGQANLFGNIPGKTSGVDVTVSLGTAINSILREVDPDPQTLVGGQPWTAQAFQCRQAWTGSVQNYIPGVHLTGQLRISPAIDRDGSLRIAKTILSSPDTTNIALAACLMPYVTYAKPVGAGLTSPTVNVPNDPIIENQWSAESTGAFGSGYAADGPLGSVPCNAPPTPEVAAAGVAPLVPSNVQSNGSQVDVAGALTVNNIDAEVLIGTAPQTATITPIKPLPFN